MCPFKFQNCFKPTCAISTILLDWSTGDSGLGRPGTAEQRGMTKRVKFSYSANKRSIREGDGPLALDFEVADEYAIIFFESSLPTSNR